MSNEMNHMCEDVVVGQIVEVFNWESRIGFQSEGMAVIGIF